MTEATQCCNKQLESLQIKAAVAVIFKPLALLLKKKKTLYLANNVLSNCTFMYAVFDVSSVPGIMLVQMLFPGIM